MKLAVLRENYSLKQMPVSAVRKGSTEAADEARGYVQSLYLELAWDWNLTNMRSVHKNVDV